MPADVDEKRLKAVIGRMIADEKLEYVPDSLMVTCYSPWDKGLWFTKYKYSGSVTGNTLDIPAEDFNLYELYCSIQ